MLAAAAFIYGRLNFFPGLAGALLDATDEFIFFALRKLEVIIGKLGKFLFQFAFGNIPVSFGGKSAHVIFYSLSFICRNRCGRNLLCK